MCRVPTYDNVADPLTKPLPHTKHESHTRSMGMRYNIDWAQCKWEIVSVMPQAHYVMAIL